MSLQGALRLRMQGTCPHCQSLLPVNRLEESIFCQACGRTTECKAAWWRELLQEAIAAAPALQMREARRARRGVFALSFQREAAGCPRCGVALGSPGSERCGGCAASLFPREASATLLGSEAPRSLWLVGEDPPVGAVRPEEAQEIKPQECTRCGAPLPLGGAQRTICCPHCRTDNHVPDAFLYRGHRRVVSPWLLVWGEPLPAPDAELGALLDWKMRSPLDDVPPFVTTLPGFGALIVSSREEVRPGKNFDVDHHREVIALALSSDLQVRWLSRELSLPFRFNERGEPHNPLVAGSATALFESDRDGLVAVVELETGRTLHESKLDAATRKFIGQGLFCLRDGRRVAPRDGHACEVVDGEARPCELTRHVPGVQAFFASGGDGLLALAQSKKTWRAVHLTEDGAVLAEAQGKLSRGEDDAPAQLARSGSGHFFLLWGKRLLVAAPGEEFRTCVELGRDGRPRQASLAALADDSVLVVADRGRVLRIGADGALRMDSKSLPRPKKMTVEQAVKISTDRGMAAAMAQAQVDQQRQSARDEARERRENTQKLRILGLTLGAMLLLFLAAAGAVLVAR